MKILVKKLHVGGCDHSKKGKSAPRFHIYTSKPNSNQTRVKKLDLYLKTANSQMGRLCNAVTLGNGKDWADLLLFVGLWVFEKHMVHKKVFKQYANH